MPLDESTFLSELREPKPDPGGGSASAFASVVGLALVEKICLLEIVREDKAREVHEDLDRTMEELVRLTDVFRKLLARDVSAYKDLSLTIRAGKRWPENSDEVLESIDCPRDIIVSALQVLELIGQLSVKCSPALVPDILAALEIMTGAARAAFHIAMSNMRFIGKDSVREERTLELESLAGEIQSKQSLVFEKIDGKPVCCR